MTAATVTDAIAGGSGGVIYTANANDITITGASTFERLSAGVDGSFMGSTAATLNLAADNMIVRCMGTTQFT